MCHPKEPYIVDGKMKMRLKMWVLAFALSPLALASSTHAAKADCVSNATCLCSYQSSVTAVSGTVEVQGTEGFLRVETVATSANDADASPSDGGPQPVVGSLVELSQLTIDSDPIQTLRNGDRAFGLFDQGQVHLLSVVNDGKVTCKYAPAVQLTLTEATRLAVSPTCEAELRTRGLPPDDGECDDTPNGCALSQSRPSSTDAAVLLALAGLVGLKILGSRSHRTKTVGRE
jgi:hypothetical protein